MIILVIVIISLLIATVIIIAINNNFKTTGNKFSYTFIVSFNRANYLFYLNFIVKN